MPDYNQIPLQDLLPQSPPMVLIHRIVEHDHSSLMAEVDITKDSLFFESQFNGVPAWVGIEYMAQTIAAFAGIQAAEKNEKVKIGFLLGSRRYSSNQSVLRQGQTYQVYVKRLIKDCSGLASFQCQISLEESVVCEAKVNVFESEEPVP